MWKFQENRRVDPHSYIGKLFCNLIRYPEALKTPTKMSLRNLRSQISFFVERKFLTQIPLGTFSTL